MQSSKRGKPNLLLRKQRLLRGWSLARVADELHKLCERDDCKVAVDTAMVWKWESGRHTPSSIYRDAFCRLYQLTADQLGFIDEAMITPLDGALAQAVPPSVEVTSVEETSTVEIASKQLILPNDMPLVVTMHIHEQAKTTTAPHELLKPQSWKHLSDINVKPTGIDPTTLSYFGDLTKICWSLSKGGELEVAEHTLWGYLPKLTAIAKKSSGYQRTANSVASQCYLLAAILAGHRDDLNARESYCEQALLFAGMAEDRNLQVASLRQLALTFDYKDRPGKALLTYQQSIPYLNEASPLLQSRMYAGLSGSHGHFQQEEKALRFLNLAYESFPEKPEDDPSFLYADCEYFTLLLWDGLTHLDLNQLKEAEAAFAQVDGLHPKIAVPERVRIEFLNYQVETFTKQRNLEQARAYLEEAVNASLALGSERRYSQAFGVYKQMQVVWQSEPQVKALGDLFNQ